MKNRYFTASLLVVALCLSGCATLSDSADPSRRANLSGTITTGPMRTMSPLEERSVRTLGLIVDMKPEAHFESVGLTVFQNRHYTSGETTLISDADIIALFRDFFATKSNIALVDLSPDRQSYLPSLKISAWDGKATFADDSGIDAKLAEAKSKGIDALLIVDEKELPDFIGHTNQRLGPKGIYHRFKNVFAYGAFRVRLMDVTTKQELKHSSYVQAICRPLDAITWKESFSAYAPDELQKITEQLKAIYLVNVDESMHMLKAARKTP